MDKLLSVIRREYVESVRTKAFALSTLLVPLLMAATLFVPQMLARSSSDVKLRLCVVDRTGKLFEALDRELTTNRERDFLKDGQRRYVLRAATPEEIARFTATDKPGQIIEEMGVDAILEVGPDVIAGGDGGRDEDKVRPRYLSSNVGDFQLIGRVEDALDSVVMALRLEGTDLTAERIKSLTQRVDLKTVKVGKGGEATERGFGQEWGTALLFTIGLYVSTMTAGMALSRGLLEEKANRVIEVLVSSVTPTQLMTGKIMGQALVVLSQFTIWGLMGAAFYLKGLGGEEAGKVLAVMSPALLGYLVIFFLLGYFLYAAFFAAVGAVCTTEMEAQQTQTPIVLMQMVPLIVAIAIVRQPGSSIAVALSMIPVFSPSVMMMRLALQTPPPAQIVASIAILLLSIIIAFWAVSKIFRVGILMTGKRMTLQEMMRWLRAA